MATFRVFAVSLVVLAMRAPATPRARAGPARPWARNSLDRPAGMLRFRGGPAVRIASSRAPRDLRGQAPVDVREHRNHALPNGRGLDLAELEAQHLNDVILLGRTNSSRSGSPGADQRCARPREPGIIQKRARASECRSPRQRVWPPAFLPPSARWALDLAGTPYPGQRADVTVESAPRRD